jgi:hypothetical protein
VNKGDTAGLSGDVDALRSAITTFTTDTRHYPKSIKDLVKAIDPDSTDLLGNKYDTTAANAWKGPYFPTSQDVSSGNGTVATPYPDYKTTAFGLTIQNVFRAPNDSINNFITLVFTNATVAPSSVAAIDRMFDGGTGTVPTGGCTGAGGASSGSIRWKEVDAAPDCTVSLLSWRLVSAAQ